MSAPRPSQVLAARMRELRERQRLTQQDLAERVEDLGAPIDRAAIARIETGARGVSLDEALLFAAALNVAPVHLFMPVDDDATVAVAPNVHAPAHFVRDWIRGQAGPLDQTLDVQSGHAYWTELPRSEWDAYHNLGMRAVLIAVQRVVRATAEGDTERVKHNLAELETVPRHYREHGVFESGLRGATSFRPTPGQEQEQ